MIASSDFAALAVRLTRAADRLAMAHIAERQIDRVSRWRRAVLLWPLFTKG